MREAFDRMKPGEVAGPVRTQFGFHILKLESKEEAKQTPFETVSAKVIQSMKARRAMILAGDEADEAFKEIYEQGTQNFAAYAQKKGLQVKDIGPAAAGDDIGLPNASFLKEAFLLPKGEMGNKAVETGDGYLIYLVKDKVNSRIPELAEVKARVAQDLALSKALERAKLYAQGLEKNRAQLESMPHQTTGAFKRTSGSVPKLELIPGVKDDLDKLASPRTYTAGGKMFIVWLGRVQPADLRSADPAQIKSIGEELLNRKKELVISQFKKDARSRHKVTITMDTKSRPLGPNDLPDNN
jgi:peptidyl-prolyl cis-trans isomerase D